MFTSLIMLIENPLQFVTSRLLYAVPIALRETMLIIPVLWSFMQFEKATGLVCQLQLDNAFGLAAVSHSFARFIVIEAVGLSLAFTNMGLRGKLPFEFPFRVR